MVLGSPYSLKIVALPDAPSTAIVVGTGTRMSSDERLRRGFIRHGPGGGQEPDLLDVLGEGLRLRQREHVRQELDNAGWVAVNRLRCD